MAYTITNTDGSVLLLLADGTVDQSATSLSLIGKNTSGFGQYINENFVKLLANSANVSGNPPRNPLKGQLWYDTTIRKLKVYDNGFKNVGGVTVAGSFPLELGPGDLWFDSVNNQLKIYNGGQVYVVGPLYSKTIGENGLIIPAITIKNTNNIPQQVTVLKNYGNMISVISKDKFIPSDDDTLNYYSTSTTQKVVSGINVVGDINYTGKLANKQLSMFIDVDVLDNTIDGIGSDVDDDAKFGRQNNAIRLMLNVLYPPNATSDDVTYSSYASPSRYNDPASYLLPEQGVNARFVEGTAYVDGDVCKVLVRYAQGGLNPNSGGKFGNAGQGYQVRRFQVQESSWVFINATDISLSNLEA